MFTHFYSNELRRTSNEHQVNIELIRALILGCCVAEPDFANSFKIRFFEFVICPFIKKYITVFRNSIRQALNDCFL